MDERGRSDAQVVGSRRLPARRVPAGLAPDRHAGYDRACVYNLDGELYAIEDRCSHDDGPLCEGEVDLEDCTVICPRHGSKFEIKTGHVLNPPAYVPVQTFPVRVDESGMIKVDIEVD